MSKQNRPQYLASTDSIGFFGRPEQFIELWQEYFDNKTLDGVEVVAFKPLSRLRSLIKLFNQNNIPVLSFHGKTGGESLLELSGKIIMTLVNLFVVNAKNIIKNFPETDFLSHGPYMAEKSIQQVIFRERPKKIWIENHLYGKQGIEDAIKQIIIYRKNNINTNGMLDIYHYVAHQTTEKIIKDWPKIVKDVELYILLRDDVGRQFFNGIHFPIGSRINDSLPIDMLPDEALELFAQKIIPNVQRVVFENQQKNLGLFFSTGKMLEDQKKRNRRIIERFKKTGIIY